jgi:ubiquitin-activating enzyme E1
MTLDGFIKVFQSQVGLEASMVSCGASLLYADFMNKQKLAPRLASSLTDVVAEVGKAGPLHPSVTHVTLSVGACDGDDEDVDIPDVRVRIR